jgi:DNA-binding MarR family transcriptional regulator
MKRDGLVQEIIENLTKCQKAVGTSSAWREIGLSHSQVGMLFMILHHNDTNVKQIAEHLGVTKSAITQLLDPLVTKGFIERQNDPNDRRIVRFNLTIKGNQAIKDINKLKFSGLRSALDNLSDNEIEQLATLHKKAAQSIAK